MQQIPMCEGAADRGFRDACEDMPVGVAHVDCDGRVLRVNERFCELSGRERDELVGLRIERLLPREDFDLAARQALRMLGGEIRRASLEMHLIRPSGGVLRNRVSLGLRRDAAGRPEHFVAVVDELGVQDCSEAALLRQQEGRLRRALDAATMDVFEYDPATGRVNRQGRLARSLGLPPGYSGTDFFSLIHSQDRAGFFAALEGLSPAHPAYTFEYRVRTPEGGYRWLVDRARGQFDERGRLSRLVGVFADITPRRQAEEALAEERELLRRTLDSIPVMLCLVDPRQQRVTLNRHFETLLGWSSADALDDGFLARLYPDDATEQDESREAIRSLEPRRRVSTVSARDGTRIPCEWIHARLSDDTKIIIGWDLRQRRAEEERSARQAERQALLLQLSSGLLQSGPDDEPEAAHAILARIGAHLEADVRFEHHADTPPGVLQLMAGFGMRTELRSAMQLRQPARAPDGAAAAAGGLSLGEPLLAGREDAALLRAMGVRAYLGHPLLGRDGRMLGMLALTSTRREAFTAQEAEFFRTLCQLLLLAGRRIQSERELRRREQQHRMALDARQLGSWQRELLDSDVYHLDARARAHYGLEQADVPQALLLQCVHPEDRARVEQYIAAGKRQRAGQDSPGIEYRVVHPDGSERWLSVHAKLVLEQREGRPVLVRHGITADISERKRIEQALQEALADLHRAQAVARVGSWRLDMPRGLRSWSQETYRVFGLPEGRPLDYARFLARVHPEDRQRADACWKAAAAGGPPYDIEHRILVGAQVKWVRQKAELEFGSDGELLGGFGTVQDITELKAADAALRDSEARFRALAESMPQMVWLMDPEGALAYCNRHFRSIPGYVEDGAGRWQWPQAVHPDDRQRSLEAWQQAVRDGTPYEIEHRVQHAGGGCRWYLSRAVPVHDEGGRITHWCGTSTDIHALKQAEAAVEETAARLRAIVDTVLDGVLVVEADGRIEAANPAAERLFGCSAAGLAGSDISAWIPALQWTQQAAGAADAAGSGPCRSTGLQGRRRDGSRFAVELSLGATPLPGRRLYTVLVRELDARAEQERAPRDRAEGPADADLLDA